MKLIKRTLSILSCAALLYGSTAITASAAERKTKGNNNPLFTKTGHNTDSSEEDETTTEENDNTIILATPAEFGELLAENTTVSEFDKIIEQIAREEGITVGKVLEEPLDNRLDLETGSIFNRELGFGKNLEVDGYIDENEIYEGLDLGIDGFNRGLSKPDLNELTNNRKNRNDKGINDLVNSRNNRLRRTVDNVLDGGTVRGGKNPSWYGYGIGGGNVGSANVYQVTTSDNHTYTEVHVGNKVVQIVDGKLYGVFGDGLKRVPSISGDSSDMTWDFGNGNICHVSDNDKSGVCDLDYGASSVSWNDGTVSVNSDGETGTFSSADNSDDKKDTDTDANDNNDTDNGSNDTDTSADNNDSDDNDTSDTTAASTDTNNHTQTDDDDDPKNGGCENPNEVYEAISPEQEYLNYLENFFDGNGGATDVDPNATNEETSPLKAYLNAIQNYYNGNGGATDVSGDFYIPEKGSLKDAFVSEVLSVINTGSK